MCAQFEKRENIIEITETVCYGEVVDSNGLIIKCEVLFMVESSGKFQEVSSRKNIKIITLLRIMHNVKSLKFTKIKTKHYLTFKYIYIETLIMEAKL